MDELVKLYGALANGNRLRILALLMEKPMCVCEIRSVLKIAQPTVTRHLQELEKTGLVRGEKHGGWMDYRLERGQSPYAAAILRLLKKRLAGDPQIKKDRATGLKADRRAICAKKTCQ